MHLLIMKVREIGLQLQGLCLSPFLKIRATFASFQSFGTWPDCSDLLKIINSIGEIWWFNSFRKVGGGGSIWAGSFVGFHIGQDIICWCLIEMMTILGMDE